MTIVNFGCGANPGPGCVNVDGSLTVLLARLPVPARLFGSRARFVAAVRTQHIKFATARRLRFRNESLDAFYTSHTLEHLVRRECEDLLGRVRGWLKPRGVLRVALPDLKPLACAYVSGQWDADTFVERTNLAREESQYGPLVLGHIHHRWMYDCASFASLLERLGYREIRQASFGRSALPELATLDVEGRRDESFYVEALR